VSESGQRAPVIVEECSRADWRQYLARRGRGSLYQRPEWDDVVSVYRLPVVWLAAIRDGVICGGGRFVWQRSLLFGNCLASLPWLDGGGFVADDEAAFDALVSAAMAAGASRGAATLLLKQDEPRPRWPTSRDNKVLLALDLPEDPDRLWKGFDPKVRNQVRKSEKSGLAVETGGIELLAEFHAIYSENMRDLGSPPHSLAFFDRVMRSFPDESRIHIVRHGGVAAGGGLTMANGQRLDIPWASSLQRYNSLCVNHALYWHILRHACLGGFRRFQFGRSTRGSGQHHFKKQWGADELPLNWYSLDTRGSAVGDQGEQAESFGWAMKAWRRMPVWAARRLGPWIIARVS
jgi:FemAB-related protein (PEP-CTERM system-associated)